jgi:hypothetical protein
MHASFAYARESLGMRLRFLHGLQNDRAGESTFAKWKEHTAMFAQSYGESSILPSVPDGRAVCARVAIAVSHASSHGLLTVQGGVLAVDRFGCACGCGCLPPMHPMKKREKKKGSPQRHIGTETRVERDRLALLGAN